MRYALDSLGWFEFEQLIQTLLKARLGLGIEAWGGRGDWGRDSYFEGGLRYPAKEESSGPFLFQSKFVESANAAGADPEPAIVNATGKECVNISGRLKSGKWKQPPAVYALFSNAPLKPATREKLSALLLAVMPGCRIYLHDGNDVCQWLNTTRDIVRGFPQLLSLRDLNEFLSEIVQREVIVRSETAIAMAQAQAKVFVPTAPYYEALACLQKNFFVVLEGPPEMGKTTIGRVIALAQLSRDWEAIECRQPEDFLKMYRKDTNQVFVADDFFGRTEYDPSRVSSWQADLPHILHRLDERHWLILTSRAHLLEMAKTNLDVSGMNDRFPAIGEVLVDAGKLNSGEKARILYRHAKAAGLATEAKQIVKAHAVAIVGHKHFTPERIRRLVVDVVPSISRHQLPAAIRALIDEAITNPTKEMRVSFRALPPCHRWFLYALLECDDRMRIFSIGIGGSAASDLQARYEELCPPEEQKYFDVVVGEMSEAFVKQGPGLFGGNQINWIHPSCRDLTIEELSTNARDRSRFLSFCSATGIHLATSVGGGEKGARQLPLLRSSKDWDLLRTRCIELTALRHDILERLWRNLRTQTKEPNSLTEENLKLQHLIRDHVLPATAHSLARSAPSTDRFKTFFTVRKELDADVPIDLSEAWRLCVEDTLEGMPDDEVIWDHTNAPADFCEFVELIRLHEPEFWKSSVVQQSFRDVVSYLSERGERERGTIYAREEEDDFGNLVSAYDTLSKSYATLAAFDDTPPETKGALASIARYFASEARSLEDDAPGEPDSDDHREHSHSSSELSVDDLFKDL